jgi:hypothetical protein
MEDKRGLKIEKEKILKSIIAVSYPVSALGSLVPGDPQRG